jgi:hypothetical protein
MRPEDVFDVGGKRRLRAIASSTQTQERSALEAQSEFQFLGSSCSEECAASCARDVNKNTGSFLQRGTDSPCLLMQCSSERILCFERTQNFHLLGRKVGLDHIACTTASLLICVLYNPEDGAINFSEK